MNPSLNIIMLYAVILDISLGLLLVGRELLVSFSSLVTLYNKIAFVCNIS